MIDPLKINLDEQSFGISRHLQTELNVACVDLAEAPIYLELAEAYGANALSVSRKTTAIVLTLEGGREAITHTLPLPPLRTLLRNYVHLCNAHRDAKDAIGARLEAIDIGRRGLHNEIAEKIQELMAEQVTLDLTSARRLASLAAVLHMRAGA